MSDRPVVYTALYGGHDVLWEPVGQDVEARWVCFTDDPSLRSHKWEIVLDPARYADARMSAKWHKCLPHLALPDAERSIWIDASMAVDAPTFVGDMLAALGAAPFAAFRHPYRRCIYTEARASSRLPKYDGLPILEQVGHYRAEGHPARWGLWAGGVLVRQHNDERVQSLGAAWLAECDRWTYQDQLSLPFVCRSLGLRPVTLPSHLHRHGPLDAVICGLHRVPALDALARRRPARSNVGSDGAVLPRPGRWRTRLLPTNPWFTIRPHHRDS